jgi:hypothetical protein
MDLNDAGVIEELTLLLLDLTSWREDSMGTTVRRAWKGYPSRRWMRSTPRASSRRADERSRSV